MQSRQQISIVRGTGIGFLLSSLAFVFTWNPISFLLVPLGTAAGFFIGRRSIKESQPASEARGSVGTAVENMANRTISHPNLLVRFLSLLAIAIFLFLLAWLVGYSLLPEGAFRSTAETQLQSRGLGEATGSLWEEWLGIFLNNLLPLFLILVANGLVRVNGIPLGYIVPLYNLTLYGLFIGTNSFFIPYPERLAPTLDILQRAGPYEMIAFLMAAAGSANWSIYHVQRLFLSEPQRVPGAPRIHWIEALFVLLSILVLGAAAWMEASMIAALGNP